MEIWGNVAKSQMLSTNFVLSTGKVEIGQRAINSLLTKEHVPVFPPNLLKFRFSDCGMF